MLLCLGVRSCLLFRVFVWPYEYVSACESKGVNACVFVCVYVCVCSCVKLCVCKSE